MSENYRVGTFCEKCRQIVCICSQSESEKRRFKELKKKMIEYRDIFGQPLIASDEIEAAININQLRFIIEQHEGHIEGAASDAIDSLRRFAQDIGLTFNPETWKKTK